MKKLLSALAAVILLGQVAEAGIGQVGIPRANGGSSSGTITGVTAGTGCSGGGSSGNVTINCPGVSPSTSVTTANCSTSQPLTFPASGAAAYLITLTGNCSLTLSGGTVGQLVRIFLQLNQDSTAGRVPTLPTGIKWPGGTPPTPNSSAGKFDFYTFTTIDGGTTLIGSY